MMERATFTRSQDESSDLPLGVEEDASLSDYATTSKGAGGG